MRVYTESNVTPSSGKELFWITLLVPSYDQFQNFTCLIKLRLVGNDYKKHLFHLFIPVNRKRNLLY